jgi:Na+/H+-dicarboxylate symporter
LNEYNSPRIAFGILSVMTVRSIGLIAEIAAKAVNHYLDDSTEIILYVLQCLLSTFWVFFCYMGWKRLLELTYELPTTISNGSPNTHHAIATATSSGTLPAWSQAAVRNPNVPPPAYGAA